MRLLEGAERAMVHLGCLERLGLFVLDSLQIKRASPTFPTSAWPFSACPVTCAGRTFCSASLGGGSGKVNRTVYPFFLLNFLLLPAFPVLTQPLS